MLADRLRRSRLTLVSCEPTAARDVMLRRGLLPLVQQPGECALRFDAWGVLPLPALREQIDRALPLAAPDASATTLADQLIAAGVHQRLRLLLVLDAFERHLREPAERADIVAFDTELMACVADPAVPLHVLLVVDDATRPALHRYTRWMHDFGRDWLRVPSASVRDEMLWSDTDIEPPPDAAEPDAPSQEAEWALDLSLDEPPQAPAASGMAVPAAHIAGSAALGFANTVEPSAAPAQPTLIEPTPVDAAAADRQADAASTAAPGAAAAPPTAVPEAAPPVAASPEASPPEATSPPAPLFAFDVTRPIEPPARAATMPPWRVEPDDTAQRQPRARWWQGPLRLGADMAALAAGMWLVATWIIGSGDDRPELRARPPLAGEPAATDTASAPVARAPATVAPVPTPTPPPAPAPPRVAAPALPPSQALTMALPIDGGAAAPMIDELVRRVAAPAGITLNVIAADAAATLAIWRHDALAAARARSSPQLRLLAPLFTEQIQVIVRNDAPWDYLREIKGLRLNIGRDGARASTARTLYQQLFGTPLPPTSANDLDEGEALQQMLRRGGTIDAMIVVSQSPLMARLPAAARGQLRELPFDPNDPRTAGALESYRLQRIPERERPRLTVTSFLVTGPAPHPQEGTLRALAFALCRAQPSLQARGSPLLLGFAPGEQPAAPWPYVLQRDDAAACAAAASSAPRREGAAPRTQR
jgi:hypothetical protein